MATASSRSSRRKTASDLILPPAYIRAVQSACRERDALRDVIAGLGGRVARGTLAHCPLPAHAHGDERPSLSFGGHHRPGSMRCHGCGFGGDAIALAAAAAGEDAREPGAFPRAVLRIGTILGIPPPDAVDGSADYERIRADAERRRLSRPVVRALPWAVQEAAFGALVAAIDTALPSAAFDAETWLRVERGIPASAQVIGGIHRMLRGDAIGRVATALVNGPHADACWAAGLLVDRKDGPGLWVWDAAVVLFAMSPDGQRPLYGRARRLYPAADSARFLAPSSDGARLPESPSTPGSEAVDGTEVRRPILYAVRPVPYGLPSLTLPSLASRPAIWTEGPIKSLAAIAMGHSSFTCWGRPGWPQETAAEAVDASEQAGQLRLVARALGDAGRGRPLLAVPDADEASTTAAVGRLYAERGAAYLRDRLGLVAAASAGLADVVGQQYVGRQADGWTKDLDAVLLRNPTLAVAP
jgi:hypothetical protein